MFIMGVDPGLKGGFAVIKETGEIVQTWPMPLVCKTQIDVCKVIDIIKAYPLSKILIEHSQAIFHAGKKHNFSFGQNFGMVFAAVLISQVTFQLIKPVHWQKKAHIGVPGKLSAKQKSALAATRLFPKYDFNDHDGIIDSCLIALYAI